MTHGHIKRKRKGIKHLLISTFFFIPLFFLNNITFHYSKRYTIIVEKNNNDTTYNDATTNNDDTYNLTTNIRERLNVAENCLDMHTKKSCNTLWKGEARSNLAKNYKFEVSVVINYCEEDKDLFTNYISDEGGIFVVRNITLISRCSSALAPNVTDNALIIQSPVRQNPDLSFIQWLLAQTKNDTPSSSNSAHDLKENHVVLFLNGQSMQDINNPNKIRDVLQSALQNGFGCVQRPPAQNSYYHDNEILKSFAIVDNSKQGYYISFGDWLDKLNISPILNQELVPVCYGNSFAIKASDIFAKSKLLHPIMKTMVIELDKRESNEVGLYVERAWASLFTYRLLEKETAALRTYATDIFRESCQGYCHIGSLLHNLKKPTIWKGDTERKEKVDFSKLLLTLVVSHCDEDMSWMKEYMKDMTLGIRTITIYSKCKSDIDVTSFPITNKNITVVNMTNVGRCDHTYAHWMSRMEPKDASDNHLVLFFKASRYLYQYKMMYRKLQDMIRIALQSGFSCGLEPSEHSLYHNTAKLKEFNIGIHRRVNVRSKFTNMGHWLDDLDIELPNPYTPVCYGGNFVVKAAQIYSKRNIWKKLEKSLTRADNIEEGHFAERTWAGLLSYPLDSEDVEVLRSVPTKVSKTKYYNGMLEWDARMG